MTAIREGIRSALKAGDPERLKALTTEARHRPARGAVTVEIDGGGARITFQPRGESTGDEIEVETSPSEAVIADVAFNQGAPSITPEQIAVAIKALDDAGDTTELEKLRDAVDLDPVGYAADFCWWEPAQSRPGHPTWRRWTVSKDKRSSLHRDSLGTMARNIETMEKLAEKMGRRMAASPKLEATFRRLAAGVGVFLTDHDWLRAGALGLRSHQIPQQDRKLCDHALRTAAEVRTRLPEVKDLLPLETALEDRTIDRSAESAWWTDVMVGALMEPETSTELAELIRDLKNARVSSVTMTDFKNSVATIIIQPTILVPAETVMGLDFTPFRTDLAHALRGMTHRMEASAGEALELQLTLDPDLSTVEVRDMLEDDDNPVLVDTEDGRAPILFPTRNDIFSSRNRYMLEKTLRAMNTRPLELMMSPNVVRRQCADAEPQAGPRGILDGISRSIEWKKRYTVRRAFMALQPDPEGNDETVLGGHPHLETGPGPGDGRLTLTLESPAWERHNLSAPTGPVTAPTALILAAQTNQQLEHGPLQTAVDQLVWSDNIEEIERTAACLAV
ncbi:MAG: hypothetical protein OXG35_04610, partial [Acidobacteria bacterium]|nr:hypothetical protein [Acidobacteriota bacterium]